MVMLVLYPIFQLLELIKISELTEFDSVTVLVPGVASVYPRGVARQPEAA